MDKNNIGVPVAIVIAGLLIAGAVYWGGDSLPTNSAENNPEAVAENKYDLTQLAPISAADHVRGNPNAQIVLIEYSDLECPFCKMLHWSMQTVIEKYGEQVAWVYRHFPLDCNDGQQADCRVLHAKARTEAIAAECVAALGDEAKFWVYIDKIFDLTPSNDGLDQVELPRLAKELGLDEEKFNDCLETKQTAERVAQDNESGNLIGVDGTPFVILLAPNDVKIPLFRANLPAEADDLTKEIVDFLDKEQQKNYQRLIDNQAD